MMNSAHKPKTALLVEIEKYNSISLAISILLYIFWLRLVILKTNESKYSHLKNLSENVKYNHKLDKYFVSKVDYKILKEGIILGRKETLKK